MVTNTNEGDLFVPSYFDSIHTPATYAAELFPELEHPEAVVDIYSNAGDNLVQLRKMFAEGIYYLTFSYIEPSTCADDLVKSVAMFWSTAYKLLHAFEGRAYKVHTLSV